MKDLYDFIDFLIVISDIYCPIDQMWLGIVIWNKNYGKILKALKGYIKLALWVG
jgi:hypothetical protein